MVSVRLTASSFRYSARLRRIGTRSDGLTDACPADLSLQTSSQATA